MTSLQFPSLEDWVRWPSEDVATHIGKLSRPLTVGWPYNGTRRWYLSYRRHTTQIEDYRLVLARRQAELTRMLFEHGVDVLLVPLFGNALLDRGSDYARYGLSGLSLLAEEATFRRLYETGVQVRFYGDYRDAFAKLDLSHLADVCTELERQSATGDGPKLLIGLFADNPYDSIARLCVEFARLNGRPPNRRELISQYYGCEVPDLDVYIGFAQHALFDVPLITTGREDLYATLNPSPAMTERQFREILYDHLVTRRVSEFDYSDLSNEGQCRLTTFVERSEGITLGLGRVDPHTGTWLPLMPAKPALDMPTQ